ncbi:DUF262 domain-containing protein [Clostridium estertheticum]|uniref:GmrSD restriction endonucleases N-terminal domain-containing protein n=1 Tax=Clostridium estertheticum subsp. estertheticum TaxID=1552 RepID=A0A1J0GFA2_9CLOT|nr:DUF262 domain-containing protein [Clostridium estertheticum]APC39648.1 hypothetical protein A7L45_05990 [Clostridium estertheticum subsp. estertheticum]MBZ9614316.1 DUF262 domain-containing protein [Clostridium estertheticum subsp. laramiense]WAG74253.1 DUF262 domain-containing protein [Clostridium estertheticum]
MNEIGVATNKKLIELFNMMKSGSLILRPRFQRNLVWNHEHKEKFIETILKGLPFPEIYLADGEIDLEKQTSTMVVVDGQQRLGTINEYIKSDEFIISNIKKFSELTDDEKKSFFDYKIVVRDLGRITDELVLDIFNRINSVQYALNSMEIRNALYQGEFIQTAKIIIENGKEFFEKTEIFSLEESSRMDDIEYILLIMSTLEEGGYFAGKKEIETYVKMNDEKYLNKDNMIKDINYAIKLIDDCKLPNDTMWYKKSNFFSLVIELVMFNKDYEAINDVGILVSLLEELQEKIYDNKKGNNEFSEYYLYIFQSTQSRKGREIRGKLIRKNLREMRIRAELTSIINEKFIDEVSNKACEIVIDGSALGKLYGDFGLQFDYLDYDCLEGIAISSITCTEDSEGIIYAGNIEMLVSISPGTHYSGERIDWSGVEILLSGNFELTKVKIGETYDGFEINDLKFIKRYYSESGDTITN